MNQTNPKTMIAPWLADRYRAAPPTVTDNLAGLQTFRNHQAIFSAAGNKAMVEVTARAWWQDACLLAGMAAANGDEASLKVAALRPALDGEIEESVDDSRCLIAMIKAGVAVECHRWRLPADLRTPSGAQRTKDRDVNGGASPIFGLPLWLLALYRDLQQPLTLRAATRSVELCADHHSALTLDGDDAAAAGAAFHAGLALIKIGSVSVGDLRGLCRKATVLGAHRALWAGDRLRTAVIEAALEADLTALKASPREQARVERLLQGPQR